MMSEKFSLSWNDFHSNVSKSFSKLRTEDVFYDVTLVSDDQKQILAHKVVLSASSDYFKNILKQNKHPNPLLCLEGVSSNELNNILDYVYNGEANIFQDDLDRFLNIAERFQLKRLILNERDFLSDENNIINSNDDDKRKVNVHDNDEVLSNSEEKAVIAEANTKVLINIEKFSSIDELDAKIFDHIERVVGQSWKCTICNKIFRGKYHIKKHVEIHFDGLKFPCSECDAILRSRTALRIHNDRKHKLN